MRLIMLYGPPAVGKLTVANELAKLTGYRVFHNHMTVDFLDAVIGYGRRGFFKVLAELRLRTIEGAAMTKVPGVIFTLVYAKPDDDTFVRRLDRVVKKHGGQVHFVRLSCSKEELFRRVTRASRRGFGKLTTAAALQRNLGEANLLGEVPMQPGLTLDVTTVAAPVAAQRIAEHYRLPAARPSAERPSSVGLNTRHRTRYAA